MFGSVKLSRTDKMCNKKYFSVVVAYEMIKAWELSEIRTQPINLDDILRSAIEQLTRASWGKGD